MLIVLGDLTTQNKLVWAQVSYKAMAFCQAELTLCFARLSASLRLVLCNLIKSDTDKI